MTNFYFHLFWFMSFFVFFMSFFVFSFWLSFIDMSFSLTCNLFSLSFIDMSFSLTLDPMSSWFSSCILFITSVVFLFSFSYMSPTSRTLPFLWLTALFVFSMIFVVNCSDLFFTMLGWDGLGLISFFLIVFYQNGSSITSGLFTVIINRLGDSLFILGLVLLSAASPMLGFLSYHLFSFLLVFTFFLCFMTNSAIFPFSSWLPAAIAAPTPISALVHSSTLVTSGLFLIIRYSYFLYCCPSLVCLLLVLTVFTSFYAGLNSLFEVDMNKLIALSTLSHLGFIGLAFSLGFIGLAFLHMLVHALFNSLLFMCMGDIMHCSFHSQDARYLSGGIFIAPFSSQVMQVCLANLLGMPLVSGFFSNDLVLETMSYSHLGYILAFVVYLNVGFTHFYTYNLFLYTLTPNSMISFSLVHPVNFVHCILLVLLGLATLFIGHFLSGLVFNSFLYPAIPQYLNLLPLVINFGFLTFIFLNNGLFSFTNVFILYYFSSMMFLTTVVSSVTSYFFQFSSAASRKTMEDGLFYSLVNSSVSSKFSFISSKFSFISSKFSFISLLFTFTIILFLFFI